MAGKKGRVKRELIALQLNSINFVENISLQVSTYQFHFSKGFRLLQFYFIIDYTGRYLTVFRRLYCHINLSIYVSTLRPGRQRGVSTKHHDPCILLPLSQLSLVFSYTHEITNKVFPGFIRIKKKYHIKNSCSLKQTIFIILNFNKSVPFQCHNEFNYHKVKYGPHSFRCKPGCL